MEKAIQNDLTWTTIWRSPEPFVTGKTGTRLRIRGSYDSDVLVLVTGLPGSGKTTIARQLSGRLALPLIGKDHYKALLFDALGIGDLDWSRRIGRAAISLQYDAIRSIRAAVVDSTLWTGLAEPEVEALDLPLVQLFCQCPFEVARARFFNRIGDRHPGHREEDMTPDDFERFHPLVAPLALSMPLVAIDTSKPTDLEVTVAQLRSAWSTVSSESN